MRKLHAYQRKAIERLLRDIERFRIPVSAEELDVLRLAATDGAAAMERGVFCIAAEVEMRNPRQALYDARVDAKDLVKSITGNPDGPVGLTDADMARLKGAGRAHDITREEVAAIRAQWDAERDRLYLERKAEDERLHAAAVALPKAEAERRAAEEGWVLGSDETLCSRLSDLRSATSAAMRRGIPMFADEWARKMAWLREVVAATVERRPPNWPRPEPYEERRFLPNDFPF